MLCSFALNRGICAVVLMEDGRLVAKSVNRAVSDDVYVSLLDIFRTGLRLVRHHVPVGGNVVFESGNSVLIRWVENNYAREEYQEAFMDALRILNEIPVTYKFVHNTSPQAMAYANESNIGRKVNLSCLLD